MMLRSQMARLLPDIDTVDARAYHALLGAMVDVEVERQRDWDEWYLWQIVVGTMRFWTEGELRKLAAGVAVLTARGKD